MSQSGGHGVTWRTCCDSREGYAHTSLCPKMRVSTATPLAGGICRCDTCGEILLEDERHWHQTTDQPT